MVPWTERGSGVNSDPSRSAHTLQSAARREQINREESSEGPSVQTRLQKYMLTDWRRRRLTTTSRDTEFQAPGKLCFSTETELELDLGEENTPVSVRIINRFRKIMNPGFIVKTLLSRMSTTGSFQPIRCHRAHHVDCRASRFIRFSKHSGKSSGAPCLRSCDMICIPRKRNVARRLWSCLEENWWRHFRPAVGTMTSEQHLSRTLLMEFSHF